MYIPNKKLNKEEYINKYKHIIDDYLITENFVLTGRKFYLTRERIRQICTRALGKKEIKKIKDKKSRDIVIKNTTDYIKKYGLEKFIAMEENIKNIRKFKKGLRWSIKYKCCVKCGTTEKKYGNKGRCMKCFSRDRWKDSEYRRKHSIIMKKYLEKNKEHIYKKASDRFKWRLDNEVGFRKKVRERNRKSLKKYRSDPEYRKKIREKYNSDPEYRKRKLEAQKRYYNKKFN